MRIGINIPNDLHRRLVPLKQYINISQICREAIEDRIKCYEKALANRHDQDVERAINEILEEERKMREIVEVNWGMLGCQDAKSWVTAAHLKDWEYLHHRQDVIRRQGRPPWVVPPPYLEGVKAFDDRLSELQNRIWQQDDQFFDWLYDDFGGIDREAAEKEYMSAWLAYTASAWDLFCQMRENHEEECRRFESERNPNLQVARVPETLLQEIKSTY